MRRTRASRARGWRKVAAAAWGPPNDPQFFGELDLDAGPVLSYIDRVRRTSGEHVTVTHLVGRAVARAVAECPEVNGSLVRGRFRPHGQVDVFFIATAGDKRSGVKVERAAEKSVVEVARELSARLRAVAQDDQAGLGRAKALHSAAPVPLCGSGSGSVARARPSAAP